MKIAMLVHNPVVSDARVRKEARSLVDAGYSVDLFGYGDPEISPGKIEKCKLIIAKKYKTINIYKYIIIKLNNAFDLINKKIKTFLKKFGSIINFLKFIILKFKITWVLLKLKRILPSFDQKFTLKIGYNHISNQLIQKIDVHNYDIIHAHDIIALIAAVKLKKEKPNLKIVWDAHELYPELNYKTKNDKLFIRDVILKSSKSIDYFITINDSFVDYYKNKFPKIPKPTVLMNAARGVSSLTAEESPLREAAGISKNQFVLLYQGGLSFNRGVEFLLEAAERIPDHWSIIFMGNGPLVGDVHQKIQSLYGRRPKGFEAIAHIPPAPYQDLAKWTSGADLGVIPYRNVGANHLYCTPNKLWEYPNAEVPILASSMVEMQKMIEKYQTGILLPREFSADDIVEALKKTNKFLLQELILNCQKFNRVENWEKYERRIVNLYNSIEL